MELAENFPNIRATVGIHPCDAEEAPDDVVEQLRRLAQSPRVAALGEIGLDYHHLPENPAEVPANKKRQAELFRRQLELAAELGLNAVIHQRDSWEDTLAILREFTGRVRGVFHCFGGTTEQAREVIALGHLVSFTGIVTFKNARQVQATAQEVAFDQFMVETDCPYLAPAPRPGQALRTGPHPPRPPNRSRSCAASPWRKSPSAPPRRRGGFSGLNKNSLSPVILSLSKDQLPVISTV